MNCPKDIRHPSADRLSIIMDTKTRVSGYEELLLFKGNTWYTWDGLYAHRMVWDIKGYYDD